MRTILRLSVGVVGIAVMAIAMAAGPARTSAPVPYGSVLTDVNRDPLRKRMTCEDKRCVRADVTPFECETALGENCVCRIQAPPIVCGSPGASCDLGLCE